MDDAKSTRLTTSEAAAPGYAREMLVLDPKMSDPCHPGNGPHVPPNNNLKHRFNARMKNTRFGEALALCCSTANAVSFCERRKK